MYGLLNKNNGPLLNKIILYLGIFNISSKINKLSITCKLYNKIQIKKLMKVKKLLSIKDIIMFSKKMNLKIFFYKFQM